MWKRAGKDLTPTVGLGMGLALQNTSSTRVNIWGFIKNQLLGTPQRASCACWELPGTTLPQQCGVCPLDLVAGTRQQQDKEVKFGVAQNIITWDNLCCAQGNWRSFLSHFCPPFPWPWVG